MKEDIIYDAISKRRLLNIVYRDLKGVTSERLTEPYEIKDGKYYGYCTQKNAIRAFKLDGIVDLEITDKGYTPRWNTH